MQAPKGVAAISAILYIHFIFIAVSIFGFTSGVSPIISFNYGAQNHEKLQKLFKLCIKITLIISVAMIAASEIFAEPLVRIFSAGDEELQQIALGGFRIFAINYLLCGTNIFASDFLPHSTTARFQP